MFSDLKVSSMMATEALLINYGTPMMPPVDLLTNIVCKFKKM